MIKIVRGSRTDLLSYWTDRYHEATEASLITKSLASFQNWGIARSLIRQLYQKNGPVVDAILARYRDAAALVLEDQAVEMLQEDRAQVEFLAARLASHMSHNWIVQRPMFERCAYLLAEILSHSGCSLVVFNLHDLDWESVAVIKTLFRLVPDCDITLGYDPHERPGEIDHNGILWNLPQSMIEGLIFDFQARGITETVDIGGVAGLPAINSLCPALPVSSDNCNLMIEKMRSAFRSFSFTSALRLGLQILDLKPKLTRAQAAELHGVIALSAHNRQFHSAKNFKLANFIEGHLLSAFASEERPAERCALLYRLAVTVGRRKGDLQSALVWADKAVSEAREAGLPPQLAAYQEAWARNIRAYILMRCRRLDEAVVDGEKAFSVLDENMPSHADTAPSLQTAWDLDIKASHSLLAHNLVSLSKLGHRREQVRFWQDKTGSALAEISGADRFEAYSWIDLYRSIFRMDLALGRALQGFESARHACNARLEYGYGIQAGDLLYRLGESLKARKFIEHVEVLRARFRLNGSVTLELSQAIASARCGLMREARERLHRALDLSSGGMESGRIQIMLSLGWLAAIGKSEKDAEEWIDRAIDLAVELGERNILLHVAASVGRTCQLLGKTQEALEAYEKGREMIPEGEDLASHNPPEVDLLEIFLGLQECKHYRGDLAVQALQLLSRALMDPETWWNLPRVLRMVDAVASEIASAADSEMKSSLQTLLIAAKQRKDCEECMATLQATLLREGLGDVIEGAAREALAEIAQECSRPAMSEETMLSVR